MTPVGLYIGGRRVDATSGETFATHNPATGAVLAEVQQASADDVDRAVASAGAGFAEWRAMTGAARGRILNDAARLLRARNAELAALEVSDTGKPIAEAIAVDVLSGADCIEYFAASTSILAARGATRGASRSGSAPASGRGTTRCRSPAGSRRRRWRAATRWCSSRPS